MSNRKRNMSQGQMGLGYRKHSMAMRSGSKKLNFLDVSSKPKARKQSKTLMGTLACANYGYWHDNFTTACYDTHNASSPIFTDTSVDNKIDRQWQWFLCNEPFFYWQE